MKKQVELSITHNGKDVVTYPYAKKEHVQFENGMNIDEFVGQDIATPTITHDTTAIKVGVGDSDVSSSVVDSAVNMTIKGQTYQNILPEPTLRNEMQGKSMQRLNEGYDSIETVDGVSKSAILKGQTLVNIENTLFPKTTGWYDNNGVNSFYRNAEIISMMNPNTDYLLYVEALPTVSQFLSVSGGLFGAKAVNLTNGKAIAKVTTTDVLPSQATNYFKSSVGGNLTQEEKESIKLMIIKYQDGMENWDIPYFTGMQSVKMPVLQTIGRNLLPTELSSNFEHKTVNGQQISNIDLTTFLKRGVRYVVKLATSKAFKIATFWSANSNNADEVLVGHGTISANNNNTLAYFTLPINDKSYYMFVNEHGENHSNFISDISQLVAIEMDMGKAPTTIEPYKTNILRTPEEVILRGLPNGVCDTLNLNTGEYVQRIGEMTFNGSETWYESGSVAPNHYCAFARVQDSKNEPSYNIVCNSLPVRTILSSQIDYEGCMFNECASGDKANVVVKIANSKLSSTNVDGVKAYLQSNPLTVQYELKTPIIKTVDLSSHGNWEKVILDGSDSITYDAHWNDIGTAYYTNLHFDHPHVFSDRMTKTGGWSITEPDHSFALRENNKKYQLVLVVHNQHTNGGNNVQGLKQYLSQNPITFWYQTTTTQDNSIREMLSFANGHLQVSSEAENSLLPSVQYEIPTKNSYHMDLMKTNTLYTMKGKSVSGTFTIDGTSYNVNTNGTFTSPSSMTDKLLIMSNKTNEEVMLLEGNVIDKTIPYFKGIKSAFEGEDKIEILSVGKNLANIATQGETNFYIGYIEKGVTYSLKINRDAQVTYNLMLKHHLINDANQTGIASGITENFIVFTSPSNGYLFFNGYSRVIVSDIILTRGEYTSQTMPSFEPYITNTTKIPLLSPLRSFPHGVYDEIILDREKNKAQIIQRIDCVVLNGDEEWSAYPTMEQERTLLFQTINTIVDGKNAYCMCDSYPYNNSLWSGYYEEGIQLGGSKEKPYKHIDVRLSKLKVSSNDKVKVRDYFRENPTTVLYELQTPIITEVDLEGFPYIYKDGHIFLNSDIAPTTEITYSINQAQQIESANENLQRHEKEISHLQKLIAQYIQVEYESTLLSLKI